jgi:hypothetical protein
MNIRLPDQRKCLGPAGEINASEPFQDTGNSLDKIKRSEEAKRRLGGGNKTEN